MGNEWEMAHATALMVGGNLQHVPVDAANYSILNGIESFLDLGCGPGHGTGNYYWVRAVMEAASLNGPAGILIGDMGNATVSWMGNGTALFALLQNDPTTALRLLLNGEANPWLTIKRQVLKPVIVPSILAVKRLWTSPSKSWQPYSGLNIHLARKLDLEGRMLAEGHDPEFNISPLWDFRLHLFRPATGIATGIASQIGARHSLCVLDPTANMALVEFLLRVPDDQFHHRGQRSWLMKRAFESRMPYPVLERIRGGLQGADIGHRILRELPAFRECLFTLEALPEVREILDMPLLHRCLDDLIAKVDPGTTERASQILLRGLGVGMFLYRSSDNHN
jgi:asparagine synthase (glutamine-hydrolysing)